MYIKIYDGFIRLWELSDIADLQQEGSIVNSDAVVQVEGYIVKVKGIRDVLTRDHMKVAFFGR